METIFALCFLFAAYFLLCVFCDIIQTAFAKYKNQEYSWKSPEVFTSVDSVFATLVFGLALAAGLYYFYDSSIDSLERRHQREIEEIQVIYEEESVYCHYCDREMPEEFAYNYNDENVCPRCVYGDYDSILEHLESMPNIFSEDCLVLERAECNICGNAAPMDLYTDNGESICVDCATEAFQDPKVANAVWRFFEY